MKKLLMRAAMKYLARRLGRPGPAPLGRRSAYRFDDRPLNGSRSDALVRLAREVLARRAR